MSGLHRPSWQKDTGEGGVDWCDYTTLWNVDAVGNVAAVPALASVAPAHEAQETAAEAHEANAWSAAHGGCRHQARGRIQFT